MTQKNDLTTPSNPQVSFVKPVLAGAIIGLTLISLFVFGVNDPKPEWGKFWIVRPLILTPLVGAMGGLFYFIVNYFSSKKGFNKALTIIIGLIGFMFALWIGIILGLDGTLWD